MMKNLYGLAWLLLAAMILGSILSGTLTPVGLVIYGLVALGLVFTLAFWSVFTNTREIKTG